MSGSMRWGAAVALVVLGLSLLAFLGVPAHGLPAPARAPTFPSAPPTAASTPLAVPSAPSPVSPAAPSAAGSSPAYTCYTPSNLPIWSGSSFFKDALVTFSVPGSPKLSGNLFQTLPCSNTLPTYTNGFWMNVSTNVPITQAFVYVWGMTWPGTPSAPPITGFSPVNVTLVPMYIQPPLFHTASFFFNDYRFFWPGSQVFFNITLVSVNATPSTIYSAQAHSQYSIPEYYQGVTNNATWGYRIASPFASSNFSSDIAVNTTPSVLTQPAFEPNRFQPITVTITSINATGAPQLPIPRAVLNVSLSGAESANFQIPFGPANHTQQSTQAFGPYPGTTVAMFVIATLPWETTQIDQIVGPVYRFNWTNNGGWWYPSLGVGGNLNFTTAPFVLGPSSAALSTGTPVNVSVHSPIQNVTIGSGEVHFHYWDVSGSVDGFLPMLMNGRNTSYAVIPGLPNGGHVTFSVQVKDSFGNPISSGNYSYGEAGPMSAALPPGYGLFYFEAVDLAKGGLVQMLNFTIANGTWTETKIATALGFGFPIPISASGVLPVAYGTYVLTVRAFGQTQSATFTVSNGTPSTIVFYVASGPVSQFSSIPLPNVTIPAIVGVAGGAIAAWPLHRWFKERRKKSEEEQRRITL